MNEFLPYFRHFYEVVRAGGFTAASRTLRVSQPSISKTIQLLEAQVGKKLLIREKTGVSLTEEGKIFYGACERIFSEVENLKRGLQAKTQIVDGVLKLAASDNLAIHILPKEISRFSAKYPGVLFQTFTGTSADIKEEIKAKRSEIGLFYTKPEEFEGFVSEQVGVAEFTVVIGAKNRWFNESKSIAAKDLVEKNVPNIGSRVVDYMKEPPAVKNIKRLGLPSRLIIECNQHEVKKKFVELGLGYSVLIKHSVEKEISAKTIKVVDVGAKISSPIYLVSLKSRPLSRVALKFCEEVLKNWKLSG